jgi:cation:H+ antiporter
MLVLGFTALFCPIATNAVGTNRSMVVTLLVTLAWVAVTFYLGLNPLIGALFLGLLCAYIGFTVLDSRKEVAISGVHHEKITDEVDEEDKNMPVWQVVVFLLIGLIGLALGARLTINSGVFIARELNVSEAIIGLTLLAVGTSLPEIGASVAAAIRKQTDVVLGNVLGSNLFNMLAAGGAIALVKDQQLSMGFHGYSHWVMVAATVFVSLYIVRGAKLGRLTALVLLGTYALYILGLVKGFSFVDFPPLLEDVPVAQ